MNEWPNENAVGAAGQNHRCTLCINI